MTVPKSNLNAIRDFFEPPTVTMSELKELPKGDRDELADLIFAETGWERA